MFRRGARFRLNRRVLHLAWGLIALAACVYEPLRTPAVFAAGPQADDPRVDVFVLRRGWHTDIGLGVATLSGALQNVHDRFPGARFLVFGFGDRRYLQSRTPGPLTLLRAIWPGAAVILVSALADTPDAAFGAANVRRIVLSPAASRALQAFIGKSFARGESGPAWVGAGPYPGSAYLASTARYSGLYTCNSWTAEALRAGGMPIRVAGTLLAGQLWSQVARLGPQRAP